MKDGVVSWKRKGVNRDLIAPFWVGPSIMSLSDLYETDCYHMPSRDVAPMRGLRPIR
jgi:hypothetical protein